jgi:hypothetical protein
VSWLFEDPTTLIVTGLLIEGLLGVALVKSGRGALVLVMLGVLVLVGSGVLIERLVVTQHEEVEDTFDGICRALLANDVQRVLSFIDPMAADIRSQVQSVLPQAQITDARVYDLMIDVNGHASPPTAQAQFVGRVKGRFRGDGPGGDEGLVLHRFTVDLRKDGERWLVVAYQDHGNIGGRRED